MQEPEEMNAPDAQFTDALRKLELAPLHRSSREIWYRAGFEAGRRRIIAWRALAAAAVLAIGAILAWDYRSPAPHSLIAARPQPVLPTIASNAEDDAGPASVSSAAYARLLNSLLREDSTALRRDPAGDGGGRPPARGGMRTDNGPIAPTILDPIQQRE